MAPPMPRRPDANADPNALPLPGHLGFLSGLLMGTADAVPGVSGSTIALVIGVYERFIAALAAVIRAPAALRNAEARAALWRALRLLVPLGAGMLLALYAGTRILVGPEEAPGILLRPETAPLAYAFLFGLVLVSVREPWRRLIARPRAVHFVVAALAALAAAAFVGLPQQTGEPPLIALLFGGAAAISVMLLPGVSGSLLLVILGQYAVVAGALHDRNLTVITVFVLGIALGVITFVPALRYLLRKAHDLTLAALTGLMAGSLRAVWPYKEGYDPKESMANVGIGDDVLLVAVAMVLGGLVVWLLARLERTMRRAAGASPDADADASPDAEPGEPGSAGARTEP